MRVIHAIEITERRRQAANLIHAQEAIAVMRRLGESTWTMFNLLEELKREDPNCHTSRLFDRLKLYIEDGRETPLRTQE